ncbi:MAG: 5-bromo-4-chloroindolyl phosphate hydrolysis family protein [Firmicutes bacterium]|nr:5-bromo-4-chloroindolyl phosphate hydrolysis family protein [Bacillota bacterium]
MAQYNREWEDIGRNIQDIVDRAVRSQDYQKLDQTVRQIVDRAVDMGTDAVRKAVDTRSKVTVQPRKQMQQPERIQEPAPELYSKPSKPLAFGIVKIVGGSMLVLSALASYIVTLVGMVFGWGITGVLAVTGHVFALSGAALLGNGISTVTWVNRFKTYLKVLGNKTHCTIEKLARSVGKSVKFARKDLQKMIDRGLFLEGHLDREETSLITSNETYAYYEQSRLQLEERRRLEAAAAAKKAAEPEVDPQVQEVLDRGNAFIVQIRNCNNAIPGEGVSAKIDRMELIVRKIFERAQAHPEIVPDLKKLMNYYLPMTIKLLNAYADMDAQAIQGETIAASKREIEDTLDTLNLAFEKLLDSVFQDTAMDVSSDISVLQTLLAQEGLTADDFSTRKNEKEN